MILKSLIGGQPKKISAKKKKELALQEVQEGIRQAKGLVQSLTRLSDALKESENPELLKTLMTDLYVATRESLSTANDTINKLAIQIETEKTPAKEDK